MLRVVEAERLDGLAEDDPSAMRSRRDLRRIHIAMGTRSILLSALRRLTFPPRAGRPLRVLELGAGDGSLLLGVATKNLPGWSQVDLTLLDRQTLLDSATIADYASAGWTASAQIADVFDWVADASESRRRWDVIVTTLFLHHFENPQLTSLLRSVAARADRFVACEPRRDRWALAGSHLVGAIGANAVTREDAVLSVQAGFRDEELSHLWQACNADGKRRGPNRQAPEIWEWNLREYSAGLFSHCFSAERLSVNGSVSGSASRSVNG